eukprot:11189753-Lingulodinium_polyedra.AAC.1
MGQPAEEEMRSNGYRWRRATESETLRSFQRGKGRPSSTTSSRTAGTTGLGVGCVPSTTRRVLT